MTHVIHYKLTPKEDFLQRIAECGTQLNVLTEANLILNTLIDEKVVEAKNLEEFIVNVPQQRIEFKLRSEMKPYQMFRDYMALLNQYWIIKKKEKQL